jgi:hypothetical protein
MKKLIPTPYGRKTPELLTKAMDAYSREQAKARDVWYQIAIQSRTLGNEDWVSFRSGVTTRQFDSDAEAEAFARKQLVEERSPGDLEAPSWLVPPPSAQHRVRVRKFELVHETIIND